MIFMDKFEKRRLMAEKLKVKKPLIKKKKTTPKKVVKEEEE